MKKRDVSLETRCIRLYKIYSGLVCSPAITALAMPFNALDCRGRIWITSSPHAGRTGVLSEQQSFDMYEKAGEPKKLVLYKKTTHYGIYNDYFDDVAANVVDWYNRHLKYHKVEVTETR